MKRKHKAIHCGRRFTTDSAPRSGTSNALKLSRELRNIPVDRYRLPKDGRKWQHVARQRMGLAEWLASHGNPDGSHVCPAVGTMMKHFGWSRRTIFNLLSDLGELKLLESEGKYTRYHGTRMRRMNIAKFLGREGVQDSGVGVQHSKEGVQDSRVGVHSNDAHNRPYIPCESQIPDRPLVVKGSEDGSREAVIAFSTGGKGDDSSLAPFFQMKLDAKKTLVGLGHSAELVHVAVERVAEFAETLEKTPRTASYFIESVKRALADPDERNELESLVLRRHTNNVPAGAALDPEERHAKSKIKFVHKIVEDAVRAGKPARTLLADRLKERL